MSVWAIGDSPRLDPLSSRAFEDNPLLFPELMNRIGDRQRHQALRVDVWVPLGTAGMWKHEPDEWTRARLRLGELIEKLASGR